MLYSGHLVIVGNIVLRVFLFSITTFNHTMLCCFAILDFFINFSYSGHFVIRIFFGSWEVIERFHCNYILSIPHLLRDIIWKTYYNNAAQVANTVSLFKKTLYSIKVAHRLTKQNVFRIRWCSSPNTSGKYFCFPFAFSVWFIKVIYALFHD